MHDGMIILHWVDNNTENMLFFFLNVFFVTVICAFFDGL